MTFGRPGSRDADGLFSATNDPFVITGPITRADLPGLCGRVCALLERSDAEIALCDVSGVEPDAVTVDALARLQLAAQRRGFRFDCAMHRRRS